MTLYRLPRWAEIAKKLHAGGLPIEAIHVIGSLEESQALAAANMLRDLVSNVPRPRDSVTAMRAAVARLP